MRAMKRRPTARALVFICERDLGVTLSRAAKRMIERIVDAGLGPDLAKDLDLCGGDDDSSWIADVLTPAAARWAAILLEDEARDAFRAPAKWGWSVWEVSGDLVSGPLSEWKRALLADVEGGDRDAAAWCCWSRHPAAVARFRRHWAAAVRAASKLDRAGVRAALKAAEKIGR